MPKLPFFGGCCAAAILLLGLPSFAAEKPAPETGPVTLKELPEGFAHFVADSTLPGTILLVPQIQGETPSAVLDDAMDLFIDTVGDGSKLVITRQATDKKLGTACAGFRVPVGDQDVEGFVVAVENAGYGQAALLLSRNSLDPVFETLSSALLAQYPQFLGGDHRFQWVPLGVMGGIALPLNWQVGAANGMTMHAVGPEGQMADYGVAFSVLTEAGAAAFFGQLQVPAIHDHCDPETALEEVFPQWRAYNQALDPTIPDAQITKILQTTAMKRPVINVPGMGNFTGGEAANILFDAELMTEDKAVPYRVLMMVYVGPESFNQWTFYYNSVAAPVEIFDRELPLLMQVYQSRHMDQKALWESWGRARKGMTKTMEIVNKAASDQAGEVKVGNGRWSSYIQEEAAVAVVQAPEEEEDKPKVPMLPVGPAPAPVPKAQVVPITPVAPVAPVAPVTPPAPPAPPAVVAPVTPPVPVPVPVPVAPAPPVPAVKPAPAPPSPTAPGGTSPMPGSGPAVQPIPTNPTAPSTSPVPPAPPVNPIPVPKP